MLIKFFKKWGWVYFIGAIFLIINAYLTTLAPKALGEAIDALTAENVVKSVVMDKAWWIIEIALWVFAAKFVWRLLVIGNARNLECYLREQLYIKLQKLPVDFFTKQRSGDLMAYAINDVGAARMAFGPVFARTLTGLVTATVSIWAMINEVDLKMTLLVLIPLPITIAALIYLGSVIRKRSMKVQAMFSDLSGYVNESIMGTKVIKTFATEEERKNEYTKKSDDMKKANISLVNAASLISPVVTITFNLSYALSLIIGAGLVLNGTISIGMLVAFLGYLLLVQTPIEHLGQIINEFQRGMASYKRLKNIYDMPEIDEKEFGGYDGEINGNIEAKNLHFTYPGDDKKAVKDISFNLKCGEKLGITGDIGSGKTVILNNILKLYEAPRGTLFINGTDISDISAKAIRDKIGYVPQDVFLFSASIKENIAFCDDNPDMQRIEECARLACVYDDIMNCQDGFDTQIGERGTYLSGGQKQRIALARAIYRNPDILLLDDTLSAVDNITEKKMSENLDEFLKGKTSVIVSSRLSPLKKCDNILYMQKGEVVERGTHEELMALGGLYAETFEKQMKGGDENVR